MHYKQLAKRASFFKSNEHGVSEMCKIMESIEQKGRAEGRDLMMRIWKLLQSKTPFPDIAKETDLSLDEVKKIAKDYGIAY